jgi:RHS repeat-associated protein
VSINEKFVPAAGLSILPGDVNADCQVSVADIQTIAARWGEARSTTTLKYDVDQDGTVTAGDLQAAAANWRATAPSPCTGPTVTKYYKLGGRLVALRQNGRLRYVHTDHLGSLSLLTDASGKVVPGSVQRVFPFGKVRTGQPVILPTSRNFTGQPLDLNTGLLYYGSSQGYGRYYDPALGRWTQPDTVVPNPSNPQDLNRYSYGRSNPLRYTDPSGHCIPGVNCPGDISGVEPPPEAPSGGEAYAAWLVHLILWEEQQQAETGGMLNSGLTQQAAAFELSTFLMKDPELAQEIVYQQVMIAAPQIAAQAAGASTDILISGAGWALGMVRQAASQRIGGAEQNLVGTKVYRVWGTDPNNPDLTKQSGPWGESWTPIDPSTVPNYREATGLPSGGKSGAFNAGRFVSVGIINDASGIQVRQALSVDGKPGGLLEFMVPNSEAQITLIGVYGVNPPY